MHSAIRTLLLPLFHISARVLNSWTSKMKPHELALRNFGIRIVAEPKDGTRDNHEEAYTALVLLSEHEEKAFELVKKHVRTIYFFEPFTRRNGHLPFGKICILDIRKFANFPAGTIPIGIAGLLVYFATLTELELSHLATNSERENLASAARDEVMERLEKIYCE